MKKILSAIYILLLVAGFGCTKSGADDPGEQEQHKKFPEPTWKADDTGKYPATMTAVISLPAALADSSIENDKLGAFVNDECRATGVVVKVNKQNLFFVLIQGLPEEINEITIRYYSKKTAYMYESKSSFTFLADAVYGTADNPKAVALTQLK